MHNTKPRTQTHYRRKEKKETGWNPNRRKSSRTRDTRKPEILKYCARHPLYDIYCKTLRKKYLKFHFTKMSDLKAERKWSCLRNKPTVRV